MSRICSQQVSVKSCLCWHRSCFLLPSVQLSVLVWNVQNNMQPIHLVDLRRPSRQDLAWRVLQMIRSSAHLFVQQLFPRTLAQLGESFTCQIRVVVFGRAARGAGNRARNQSFTHTFHCVDGCIANVYNLQPHHDKPFRVCVNISCTHAKVTILVKHNRLLIHAHVHLENNTMVKRTKRRVVC